MPTYNGTSGADGITGTSGDDNIYGGGGTDTLYGGEGNDVIADGGSSASGTVTAGGVTFGVDDVVDYLDGGNGNDQFLAGRGDTVIGGSGIDRLNVVFAKSTAGLNIDFSAAWTGASFTFGSGSNAISGSGIEVLEFATGSLFADILISASPAGSSTQLHGLLGADDLYGGAGNDSLYANHLFDVTDTDADQLYGLDGNDSLFGGIYDDLDGGSGLDTLHLDLRNAPTGISWDFGLLLEGYVAHPFGADVVGFEDVALVYGSAYGDIFDASDDDYATSLRGEGGSDVLIGGAGADSLDGGTGDDGLDGGAGNDALIGGDGNDELYGHLDNDTLNGGTGNDELYGEAGNDTLIGETGSDAMYGGTGNDVFFIDAAGDQVFEATGEGTDRVATSVSYALAANASVETLETTLLAGTGALNLTGNATSQYVIGNNGNNVLEGGGGNDWMIGAGGNDTFIGSSSASTLEGGLGNDVFFIVDSSDLIIEAAGGGNDRAAVNTSYTLAASAAVETLETLELAGTSAFNLTGNAFAQTVIGNAGNNVIDGKGGADVLIAGGGADTLAFTTALGGGNVDTIEGFQAGIDKVALDDAILADLNPGSMDPNRFVIGSSAGDGDDRIVYNPANGTLWFDADGNGAGAAVQIATFSGAPTLASTDFMIV